MDRETQLAIYVVVFVASFLVVVVLAHLRKLDPRLQRIGERLNGLASAHFSGSALSAIGTPTTSPHHYRIRRVRPGAMRRRLRLRGADAATGNAEFDARFSLECDDPGVAEWLRQSPEARELIGQLVDADRHLRQRERRLTLTGTDLLAHEERLDGWAAALHRLAALAPSRLLGEHAGELASGHRVFPLLLAASAICATAVCALIWAVAAAESVVFPQNVSLTPLLLGGGLAGAFLGGAWLWLARRLLRGSRQSARLHRQFILAGAVAPVVLGMVVAAQGNLHWGDGMELVDETEVVSVDSYPTGGRRRSSGRDIEMLTLGTFADGRVPEQSYRSRHYINKNLWPGQRVRVHWREGALGVPVITRRPVLVRGDGGS